MISQAQTMLTNSAPKTFRWQKTQYSPLARQREVFSAAGYFLFCLWLDQKLGRNSPQIRQKRAQWLVQKLLDLGPTFIKIGQALSTRADILPLEYVRALSSLQDQVPEFSANEAIALIESELGSSIYSLYRDFKDRPIAAASLGQVHLAQLHTGQDVVVKVQRPGLQELFQLDFQALGKLLRFCRRWLPWTKPYNLEAIYDEFFNILYLEIDYVQEAKNAEKFASNFKDYPEIIVPKIYWERTTTKILTSEYLPGIKIDDRETIEKFGLSPQKINQIGICCYLKQILIDGFFQADPHPGNMALTPEGQIIFYDFGMMSEVNSLNKEEMIRTFFAVLRKDTDEVITTLINMGLISQVSDMRPVRRMITFLLDKFTEKPIDFQAFGEIKGELYAMFEQQPFRLPAQMTFILKALTTLDGLARSLDPQYNLVAAAQPFVKSITASQGRGSLIQALAKQTRSFIQYKLQQPSASERAIRHLEERIAQGELELQVRSMDSDRVLRRISLGIKTLIYACLTGFTFLGGAVFVSGSLTSWAIFAFTLCGLSLLFLLRSLSTLAFREKIDQMIEK